MRLRSAALAALAAILLAACADNRPPEEIVAERAQARWDALVARDFDAAYEYYTPGYRELNTSADFAAEMRRRPVTWTAAEVFAVECEADSPRCEVRARLNYSAPGAIPGVGSIESSSGVREMWIQIGRKWWYSVES